MSFFSLSVSNSRSFIFFFWLGRYKCTRSGHKTLRVTTVYHGQSMIGRWKDYLNEWALCDVFTSRHVDNKMRITIINPQRNVFVDFVISVHAMCNNIIMILWPYVKWLKTCALANIISSAWRPILTMTMRRNMRTHSKRTYTLIDLVVLSRPPASSRNGQLTQKYLIKCILTPSPIDIQLIPHRIAINHYFL